VRESTSAVTALPFTVIETDGIGIPPQTRAERPVFLAGLTTRRINRRETERFSLISFFGTRAT
jgi:hypothetical protein